MTLMRAQLYWARIVKQEVAIRLHSHEIAFK